MQNRAVGAVGVAFGTRLPMKKTISQTDSVGIFSFGQYIKVALTPLLLLLLTTPFFLMGSVVKAK